MKKCKSLYRALVVGILLSRGLLGLSRAHAALPDQDSLIFVGEKYGFGQHVQTLTQQAQEYIRPSETMDNWTQRLAVRFLPYSEDPVDYAAAVRESVTLYNPEAQAQSEPSQNGTEAKLSFQLWNPKSPDSFYELHLVRARRHAGGLVIHEFVYRQSKAGDAGLENFRKAIKPHRDAWEKALDQARWPLPPADTQRVARWQSAVKAIRWYIHNPHVFVERKLLDVPFTLAHRPAPPEHAWLYIRPEATLDPSAIPIFLDAVRAFHATGLDMKRQPSVTDESLPQIVQPNIGWPIEPGWRSLIDGLRYLNLKGTSVTDQGAPTLAQMTPLQVLILNDAITDNGLKLIAPALTNLAKFRPGGPAITDGGMAALNNLHKLHRLDLSDTAVTGKGLRALKGLPLVEVDLGPAMGDDALAALVEIPTMAHLEMRQSQITNKGVPSLKRFTRLHTLFIGSQLDHEGVRTLVQILTLRRLDVSGSRITDEDIKALSGLKDLQELALSHTAVTDQGIAALAHLTQLRFLEISDTRVTLEGLRQLSELPSLDVISFSHTGPLKLGDLKPLGALPKLRTIIINGAPLKHEAMDYLRSHAASKASWPSLWVAIASAASMPPLNDNADVALLQEIPSQAALSDSGLRRIHDVESDLDHVIPAVETSHIDTDQDTQANFLGEFTVGSKGPKSPH